MIKLSIFRAFLVLYGLMADGMHLTAPSIPKAASQGSLVKTGKKKKSNKNTIIKVVAVTQIIAASQDDVDIMNDLRIASAMRCSLNEQPLVPEFKAGVASMSTLSEAEKWKLLGMMVKFDATAQGDSKDCDEKLRKISRDIGCMNLEEHHAHAPKSKHKRGDSY